MKKQNGSAHIIIIAAMTILLIGVLGFIFWQNFIHKPGESNKTVSNVSKTTGSNTKASEPVEEKGTIVGTLTYPSEGIPSWVEVHATNLQTKEDFVTKDHLSGSQYKTGFGYTLSVPAGTYYVYSPKGDERAYYDNFVECGFTDYDNCKDATAKITVTVEPNKETKDIMVGDWYNPCVIPVGEQPTKEFDLPTC